MNAITPIAETEDTVTVRRADWQALLDALEDAEDLAISRAAMADVAAGRDEVLPAAMVSRMLAGDSRVRLWREHRGLTAKALAAAAGLPAGYLSEIERGKKPGSVDAFGRLARALGVTLDDLAPPPRD